MFLKLPLEAEVPDEVYVGDYVLTCKQTSDWEAEYRDRTTQYSPSIDIDLAEGEIRGYVSDNADPFTLRFSADGEWLYESVQTIAECMDNDMKGINKATKKSKTQSNKLRVKADMAFSEMVAKQRAKNRGIAKMVGATESFTIHVPMLNDYIDIELLSPDLTGDDSLYAIQSIDIPDDWDEDFDDVHVWVAMASAESLNFSIDVNVATNSSGEGIIYLFANRFDPWTDSSKQTNFIFDDYSQVPSIVQNFVSNNLPNMLRQVGMEEDEEFEVHYG